jgi:NADH:ubiquinone oxidoreductase subunit F (NADH-binding)/NADH:ubiquinone oxidoreductase subunit E
MIIQELRLIQDHCGYLPEAELRALAERLRVPLYRLHEVASFYPHYRLQPPPAVEVQVCRDMACFLRGAGTLRRNLEALASDGQIAVGGVSCLGQCDGAPAVCINDHVYRGKGEAELTALVRAVAAGEELPRQQADRSPCGWRIDPYQGQPRYEAVRWLIEQWQGDSSDNVSAKRKRLAAPVLQALETANLRGMGGAGFPTFRKWQTVLDAAGPTKYVVCNADESEPGTFKDRELLRRAPHLLVEGMVLAGLVTGAERGYVYVRHEYHDEIEALEEAIRDAERQSVCGERLLGSELSFPLEIFVSPGGYICGEESALLEAMEDRRAEPRNKPPFPVQSGLFGRPTVINNVETLCWVPAIVRHGGAWYRDQGVNGATGLRFVSVSGDVERPGVYEVPFGQAVRDLLAMAGGLRDGQRLQAIAPSGPSGGFLPAVAGAENLPEKFVKEKLPPGATAFDILDLTLDIATVSAIGSMLGGAFVAVGDRTDIVELALNCTRFFRNESCGKCVPCRVGSQKLVELLESRVPADPLPSITDLAEAMQLASICGLGQVAANPLLSALRHFRS